MRVESIHLVNFKSHVDTGPIRLGPVTVLVGANNAGKSSILQGVGVLQGLAGGDSVRRNETLAEISLELSSLDTAPIWGIKGPARDGLYRARIESSGSVNYELFVGDQAHRRDPFPQQEPNHFVIPFMSKRKVAGYSPDITLPSVEAIRPDLNNLPAKLSRLSNASHPSYQRYAEACEAILGYVVTNIPVGGGHTAGFYIDDRQTITISEMGDGVPQVVGLLVELLLAKEKLFLIEELENDLHPLALKQLLDLIVDSAANNRNQFVLTTHSHIVTRYLGSVPESRVYNVTAERGVMPPTATIEEIADSAGRLRILRELGYEVSDFELWDAWLILEESSAERIIGNFLIPWFAPKLQGRLRTLAAGGTSKLEPTFEDFRRLFLFAHLEPMYSGRSWVLADGDESGRTVIAKLKAQYGATWGADHFRTLNEPDFEMYYPARFADKVSAALGLSGDAKREAKRLLLEEVLQWCRDNPAAAQTEFETSAAEVIEFLQEVSGALASGVAPPGS